MKRRSFLATAAAALAGVVTRKLRPTKPHSLGFSDEALSQWLGEDQRWTAPDPGRAYLIFIDHSGKYHIVPYDTDCKAVGYIDAEA